MAQDIKYFGQNRMAAYQNENVASRNKDLVKYRPEWGLGPKGMMGSRNEGWNPTMGDEARDEMMVDVEPETKMYHGQKKKIPYMQAAGMYWDGSGVKQMSPGSMMRGNRSGMMEGAGGGAGPDPAKERASAEMVKGFKMLHKNSPELQGIVKVEDWDDMSPNAIRGIMGGMDIMGKSQGRRDKSDVRDEKMTEQSALAAAAENSGDAEKMMQAYTAAGGSKIGDVKAMQTAIRDAEPWKPTFGKEGDREYMMTSRNSAQALAKKRGDLKIPYRGPVIEDKGVTLVWNDKEGGYRPFNKRGDDWMDQIAGSLQSRDGGKKGASKSKAAKDPDELWN